MTGSNPVEEYRQLKQAIASLEARLEILGNEVLEAALGPMHQRLAELEQLEQISKILFESERKLVTVLFADFSGFASFTKELDPEIERERVYACFNLLAPIIHKYAGTIEKFIGDEIMVIFGAPIVHENDPERAIRSALEMMAEIEKFNHDFDFKVGIHIGISTGMVIAGGIGSEGRQQYGVTGDTVNLAKRLQDMAPAGGVLVSYDTYRHVRDKFIFIPQESILVKGKAEPVLSYQVEGVRLLADPPGLPGIKGVETRMIGRSVELASLQNWLEGSFSKRQTTLVTVFGEAGVGKSRLLHEFDTWLENRPGRLTRIKGRCTHQGRGLANGLVRDLFTFYFGIAESDPIEVVRNKLETGVGVFLKDDGKSKSHFIGAWLGFDFGSSPHLTALEGDAEQLHNRAMLYLGQFFTSLTKYAPVVIILEDLHWVDGGSLNALLDLCGRQPELPLYIVCEARPDLLIRRPAWGKDLIASDYKQIDLQPLTEIEARDLVVEIMQKMSRVPPILMEALVNRAEGNPYFLEEMIQMLIDQGVICTETDSWKVVLEKLADLQVPVSLTAVLQARLDNLEPQEKQALQQAAVVGRVFWDSVLAELGVGSGDALTALVKREMVLRRRESAFIGATEYIFKHALLRDVTYETVLKRVRRAYHRMVGGWLGRVADANGRTDEYAAIIGGHYEAAGEITIAAEWYGRAGKQAAGQFDQEAAENWLSRAIELTPMEDRTSHFELLMARERLYHLTGMRKKQAADLAFLAELTGAWEESPKMTPDRIASYLIRQAAYAMAVSDYPAAISAVAKALDQAETVGDGKLAAAALANWGEALSRQGDYDISRERHAAGQEMAVMAGAKAELAENLKGLGIVAYLQGDYSTAQKYQIEALEIEREIGDKRGESRCLSNLGIVTRALGNYAGAHEYYQAALGIDRDIGSRRGESVCLNNLGNIAYLQGDYAGAREYYLGALDLRLKIGDRRGESVCINNLGNTAFAQGDKAQARVNYKAALKMRMEIGDRRGEGLVLHNLGVLAIEEDDLDSAEKYFYLALEIREELGVPHYVVEDQAGLAAVFLGRGDPESARRKLSPVLAYLNENPTIDGAEHPYRVLLTCGRVLMEVGEIRKGIEILGAAHSRLVAMADQLPTAERKKQFWQVREYAAIRQIFLANQTGSLE